MIGDWAIERDGDRVYLSGPGECEITLDKFDPSRIVAFEQSAEEWGLEESEGLFTQTMIRVWVYPLGFGAVIRLRSVRDASRPAQRPTHYLEVESGACEVSWMVWDDFAEALHALGTGD